MGTGEIYTKLIAAIAWFAKTTTFCNHSTRLQFEFEKRVTSCQQQESIQFEHAAIDLQAYWKRVNSNLRCLRNVSKEIQFAPWTLMETQTS